MDTLALRVAHHLPDRAFNPPPDGIAKIGNGVTRAVLLTPRDRPERRYPLVTVLHGAGRQDEMLVKACRDEPDRRDAFFLVPRSPLPTWDLIASAARPDLDFLEYAYDLIYRRYPIDPARQALLGYSDGASYALSVGLSNPHLSARSWAGRRASSRSTRRSTPTTAQAARPARVRHARPALPVRARGAADAREPAKRRLHRGVSHRRGREALALARLPARRWTGSCLDEYNERARSLALGARLRLTWGTPHRSYRPTSWVTLPDLATRRRLVRPDPRRAQLGEDPHQSGTW